jgi:hypothetical protein
MGSQSPFFRDSRRSHNMKMIQPRPERINVAMIGALFQGYSRPACSKAKTSKMEAARDRKAPRKSIRFHAFSVTRVPKKLAGPGYGKLNGIEVLMRKMATTPAGPLEQVSVAGMQSGERQT